MEITLTQNQGSVPVLHLQGKLDGSNYQTLITEAQKIYDGGARDVILDLSQLTFISSAGISALHRVALLFRGQKLEAQEEEGWGSYHAIANDRDGSAQKHVKLLSPLDNVQHSLEIVGFNTFFEIYTNLDKAVASFQ
ncbi:MAG TPA: STAS domain-containing protein [Anaerolineales bacterium]|jgi:ABC-type transporter Mla MlaB component